MHAAPRAIAGAPRGTQVLVVYGENDPGLNELERAGRSRGGPPAPCSGESVIGVRDQLFRHAVSISLRTNVRPDSCRSTPCFPARTDLSHAGGRISPAASPAADHAPTIHARLAARWPHLARRLELRFRSRFGAPPRFELHCVGRTPDETKLIDKCDARDAAIRDRGMERLISAAARTEDGEIANTMRAQPIDRGAHVFAERAVEMWSTVRRCLAVANSSKVKPQGRDARSRQFARDFNMPHHRGMSGERRLFDC